MRARDALRSQLIDSSKSYKLFSCRRVHSSINYNPKSMWINSYSCEKYFGHWKIAESCLFSCVRIFGHCVIWETETTFERGGLIHIFNFLQIWCLYSLFFHPVLVGTTSSGQSILFVAHEVVDKSSKRLRGRKLLFVADGHISPTLDIFQKKPNEFPICFFGFLGKEVSLVKDFIMPGQEVSLRDHSVNFLRARCGWYKRLDTGTGTVTSRREVNS